jgi:hypothetical protein
VILTGFVLSCLPQAEGGGAALGPGAAVRFGWLRRVTEAAPPALPCLQVMMMMMIMMMRMRMMMMMMMMVVVVVVTTTTTTTTMMMMMMIKMTMMMMMIRC